MNTSSDRLSISVEAVSRERLVRLLADYLLASLRAGWPGTDGLTVGGVVAAAYPAAVAVGAVPGPAELDPPARRLGRPDRCLLRDREVS